MFQLSKRGRSLILAGLVLIIFWTVTASLAALELGEMPYFIFLGTPVQPQATETNLPNIWPWLGVVTAAVLPLIIIQVLLVPHFLRKLIIQLGRSAAVLLALGLMLYRFRLELPSGLEQLATAFEQFSPGEVEGSNPIIVQPFSGTSPEWLVWALSALTAGIIVLGTRWLWMGLSRLRARRNTPEPEEYIEVARAAMTSIQEGEAAQQAVLRCYQQMLSLAARQRGLVRPEHMTPSEFRQTLEMAGLPGRYVQRLTSLFERVRYGAHTSDPKMETEALHCLQALALAMEPAA